ncbi:MAG: hypothetical protein MR797_05800 [Lachnospiraceae bacterium]|nr:hypothetical protein [Lachnospiraceae bacterium]
MVLSEELVANFVKSTNDKKTTSSEATVYGTVRIEGDKKYVQIDGSSIKTPVNTTSDISDGDRVIVLIKNHEATIIGNVSAPSAKNSFVSDQYDNLQQQIDALSPENIIELTQTVNNNENNIARLQESYNQANTALGEINGTVSTITDNISSIEQSIGTAETNIFNLQTDVTNLQTDVTNLRTDVTNLQASINDIIDRLTALENA